MMTFLRLIRWPNLLIVLLTQGLLYFFVLLPPLHQHDLLPSLDVVHFGLYILVTIILTATGYIINDLLDVAADRINKPHSRIIERQIQPATAIWLYWSLGMIGFFISLYLALIIGRLPLLGIYPLVFWLLYGYSARLKKEALTGNLLIALFCAGVAGAVWLAEWTAISDLARRAPHMAHKLELLFVWYMVFAFLATLYREMIKDMEDVAGDRHMDCRTLPIRYGMMAARRWSMSVGLLLLLFLSWQGWMFLRFFREWILVFLGLGVVLPLLLSFYWLAFAQKAREFHRISTLVKVIMLNGLILLFFANS